MLDRYYGRLREKDLEIKKYYKDKYGLTVIIEAGPHGWTIVYTDQTNCAKDEELPSEENFANAYKTAVGWLGELTAY